MLLVDDSAINTRMLVQALSEYDTLVATNGPDAISLALTYTPDIILLDVQMPGMDGFEVCRLLRESPKTRDIPVIFLTGLMEPGSVARGFQVGAVDYITKPFEFAEVKARLATHLDLCRARRALAIQNRLLEKKVREQRLNIDLARKILGVVNGGCPRYVDLGPDTALFCLPVAVPCREEGGDHYFVRTLVDGDRRRTVVSIKDQSGHAVNCILRSIATDLFHNAILARQPAISVDDSLTRLNDVLCTSGFFAAEDFCTGVAASIDHNDLTLRYSGAGHPPFFLVRDRTVQVFPPAPAEGNLPLAVREEVAYRGGTVRLQIGDRLLFYTDGLLDLAARKRGQPFRQRDLVELVAESVRRRDGTVSELVADILGHLSDHAPGDPAFKEELPDDLTLLGLEVESAEAGQRREFVPQDFDSIDRLIEAVKGYLGVDDARFAMAVSEAVLNAWRHGNRQRQDVPITVGIWQGNDDNVAICDQGEGFDPAAVADPTSETAKLRESGRGIFIMRKFAAWVRWRRSGREVILSRARGTLPPPPPAAGFSLW